MRGANQMTSLMQLRETIDSREFHEHYRAALHFLTEDLSKPEVRRKILEAPSLRALPELEDVLFIVNIFENTGCRRPVRCTSPRGIRWMEAHPTLKCGRRLPIFRSCCPHCY